MSDLETQILGAVSRKNYEPTTAKALARKLGLPQSQYTAFRRTLRELAKQGRIEFGKNHTVRSATPHGTVTGIYRRTTSGLGFVRPHAVDGRSGPEIRIREDDAGDAATGD